MATFKAIVKSKRSDNTYKVYIRVTHNKKLGYIPTQWYATQYDVVKSSLKIKNQSILDRAEDLIRSYRHKIDNLGNNVKTMPIDRLIEILTSPDDEFRLDFIGYGFKYADRIQKEKSGTAENTRTALRNFIKYLGRDSIDINNITKKLIQDYVSRLTGARAPSLYFSLLRKVYNTAKGEFNDEDLDIINIPRYPFKSIELPPVIETRKRAIPIELIREINQLPDRESIIGNKVNRYTLAKDLFILSFCLAGMNSKDIYECDNYNNDRIIYNRAKTRGRRTDKALFSLKVEPEIKHIFNKYKDETGERVFNFYKHYADARSFNRAINKGLKKIGDELEIEDLEYYAARHSWATIAVNDLGIDKMTVHEGLNHADPKMKITEIYIKKSWSNIDKANREVLDYLFDKKQAKKKKKPE